jgi:hypothetical protein
MTQDLSPSLVNFMQEMLSYRRVYLGETFSLGSDLRRKRSKDLFKTFLNLSEQDKRGYFLEMLKFDNFPERTAEIFHSICLPFLGHMFKNDFEFVQEYYGRVKYESLHNKEIPKEAFQVILNFLPQDFHFDHKVYFSHIQQTDTNGNCFYPCEIKYLF